MKWWVNPKLEKVGPKLEKEGPKLEKVGSKLEKVGPNLKKWAQNLKKWVQICHFFLVKADYLYQKRPRKKPAYLVGYQCSLPTLLKLTKLLYYTVADKKNCPPCTVLFRKSYKIGFTSSIAMNIMKLGNTVVFGLV